LAIDHRDEGTEMKQQTGNNLYAKNCQSCHGANQGWRWLRPSNRGRTAVCGLQRVMSSAASPTALNALFTSLTAMRLQEEPIRLALKVGDLGGLKASGGAPAGQNPPPMPLTGPPGQIPGPPYPEEVSTEGPFYRLRLNYPTYQPAVVVGRRLRLNRYEAMECSLGEDEQAIQEGGKNTGSATANVTAYRRRLVVCECARDGR
jgi:hypothetical protein